MGYQKKALFGFGWMGAFRIVSRIFAILRIAIIARILSPNDFGVFGVAVLALTLLETITQADVGTYLIQEKKKLKENINTAYFLTVVRGFIIALFLLISARPISFFFGNPQSISLIQLLSIVAVVKGFMNPARVTFLKELDYKKEFILNVYTFLADSLVSVLLVIIIKSPVALVWGLLAGSLFETIYSWVKLSPKPKFTFDNNQLRSMLKRGKWFTAQSVSNYLFEQGDDMAVGKLLNTSSLGIYQTTYKISTAPITEISRVFSLVTFPIYTKISEQKERLKKAFMKMMGITVLLTVIIGVFVYVFSNSIVLILLGKKWIEAVPILRVLSVFGVLRAIIVSVTPLFYALKKQDYNAKITLFGLLVMISTIGPFVVKYGVIGACYSVVLASILSLPITYWFIRRVFKNIN